MSFSMMLEILKKREKEKHTSIAMCKLKLDNGNVVNIYGYDEVADTLYRDNLDYIHIEGRIDSNMMIEIETIFVKES